MDAGARNRLRGPQAKLLKPLALFLLNPDKPFVIRTKASDYAKGAVLEETDEKGNLYPVSTWSLVLIPSQRMLRTPWTKEAYAIVSALRKLAGDIGFKPVCVCMDHQSLRTWHMEFVVTPSGPAACLARENETFSRFNLSVMYVPACHGKDNTMADVVSLSVYPASCALQDVSVHGNAKETEPAQPLIGLQRQC